MASKDVEVEVEIVTQTDKAYLVDNGTRQAWVPKSAVSDYCEERGRITSIFVPERLALEKGLI